MAFLYTLLTSQESGCARAAVASTMPNMVTHNTAAAVDVRDYRRIEKAINFIDANFREQPTLKEIAAYVNLSEYHFQRLFRRWAGISPKRFLQFLTAEHAARLLHESRGILDVTHETGLASSGRLHDLLVNIHAVTPGEWKSRGAELVIHYGFHPSPFGECLLGVTERGICALEFVEPSSRRKALAELAQRWPSANLQGTPRITGATAAKIFGASRNRKSHAINLYVKGTNFQIKVWEALLCIPPGAVTSYEDIATHVGAPRAVRAVGSGVARNPIAYLIPCHRVIRKTGVIGEYHWGTARKKALLAWEAARLADGV